MRIPLTFDLKSRDGTLDQDAIVHNGIITDKVRRRPGLTAISLLKTGVAQMLESWYGLKAVIGDYYIPGGEAPSNYTNSTTWNPSDKDAAITLSGSNLVATSSGALSYKGVRSSFSISSTGYWYFEVTVTTFALTNNGDSLAIGIANSSAPISSYYDSINSRMIFAYRSGGTNYFYMYLPFGSSYAVPSFTAGDIFGFLVNKTNNSLTVYKNGAYYAYVGSSDMPTGATYAYMITYGTAAAVTANFAGAFAYTPSATQVALTVNSTNLPMTSAFSSTSASTKYLFFKNSEFGWYVTDPGGSPTRVSDTDYPGNMTPVRLTVPGVVYLDGRFYVMDTDARIYNSAADNPSSWAATDFLSAQSEPGQGAAIAKSGQYVVAFKEFSVELFYNAGNPTGSPLSRVEAGLFKIGCASGYSVVAWNDAIVWVGQSKQRGRGVWVMNGLQHEKISTDDVDRVINADTLSSVYAYAMRLDGCDLYLLTLVGSSVTLVYNFTSKKWCRWSSLVESSSIGVNSLVLTNGEAALESASNLVPVAVGDTIFISGAAQTEYNGYKVVTRTQTISSTLYLYFRMTSTPASPATGTITYTHFTESYFKQTKYCNNSGSDVLLHESNGYIYLPSVAPTDAGLNVKFLVRTDRIDGGSVGTKQIGSVSLNCSKLSDKNAYIRYSDDDCATYVEPKPVSMSLDDPKIRRCGDFIKRTFEVVGYYESVSGSAVQEYWESLEVA